MIVMTTINIVLVAVLAILLYEIGLRWLLGSAILIWSYMIYSFIANYIAFVKYENRRIAEEDMEAWDDWDDYDDSDEDNDAVEFESGKPL